MVNVPCSHAGHYEAPGSRDYRRGWESQINRNYKRVAEVWMGDYKRYLYYYHPDIEVYIIYMLLLYFINTCDIVYCAHDKIHIILLLKAL